MKEIGWIVAPKRRDKKQPSYTKGVSDCYEEKAVYVFPREADALEIWNECDLGEPRKKYRVFKVEVVVKEELKGD